VLISVLLPARDATSTLAEALSSLIAQRGAPPSEIVCVDDASVDATPSLLAGAARGDARVRVIRAKAGAWSRP
jgi:glycosyltransferase involved in cell wall biosynthesis